MSAAEAEVTEAIVEAEQPAVEPGGIDMDAALESIASDLFPNSEKKDDEESDNVETDEEVDEEVEEETGKAEEEPVETEVEDKLTPPQSWAKDTHELWDSMTKAQQDQVVLRETQMKEGLDTRKQDADMGIRLRDNLEPFKQILSQHNIDPVDAASKVLASHIRIATAPIEQKKQLLNQLAQSYGITDLEVKPGEAEDPKITQLMNEINQVKQTLGATQQASLQEAKGRIETEVSSFATEHDHFDDLSDEIAHLIRADYSLEKAYEIAYRASPYFEKDLEKQREEKLKKDEQVKKTELEKAKKAKSVNVRGRDTKKAPTAPKGTMEDTMHEVMREIKNRN